MILVIFPWSVRNYYIFTDVVPISTNVGDVFYRANNPMATSGFLYAGQRNLNKYLKNEVIWNKTGYEWCKEWIKENPLSFINKKASHFFRGRQSWGLLNVISFI